MSNSISTFHLRLVLAATAAVVLAAGGACAQGGPADAGRGATAADLPVTRLVLFTSGVGYFEHSGTVTDAQELDLSVAADQMDDLLQSLVVQDLDGGVIGPVQYPSRDPLDRILAGYSLDVSGETSLPRLLQQARGEGVHLGGGAGIDGVIVDVESVTDENGAPQTFLTLATGDGLRRVALAEVGSIRFRDPAVQADLDAALATVARYRGSDDRTVRLRFEGTGTRRVRVAYVREMPVWKTSYRLVVGDDGRADLQGWAIVDNPTNLDLHDVSISFVAGRPISFVTGLYDPIYLPRPHVQLDLARNLAPPAGAADSAPAPAPQSAQRAAPSANAAMESAKGMLDAAGAAPAAPQLGGVGVEAMAQGVSTGATFEYRVKGPVTVARHQSAMIPIVLERVPAERLSLYDASVLTGHPLRGVRLVNDTDLHLAAGPVTVFDDAGFGGNARVSDIVAGDSRILTYAVDLGAEVRTEDRGEPEKITAVSLRGGVLESTVLSRISTTYTLDARDGEARFVVLEHPKRQGYTVVAPAGPAADTATSYRFGVAMEGNGAAAPADATVPTKLRCAAGETCALHVVMERTDRRSTAVSNVSSSDLAFYLENVEMSAGDRATLDRVLALERRIADLDRQMSARQARIDAIFQDQNRIRQNMGALDRNSALYRRYATDLENQENELETLRNEADALSQRRDAEQRQLDDLIAGLTPAT